MICAWGGANSRAVVFTLGEIPGSEWGGEPSVAVRGFIKEPQLMVPGSESEGGVWVERGGPTRAVTAFGLVTGVWRRPAVVRLLQLGASGLSAWRGSSGFDSGPAPSGEKGRSGWAEYGQGGARQYPGHGTRAGVNYALP